MQWNTQCSRVPLIKTQGQYHLPQKSFTQSCFRLRVLEEIERCDCPHFLILFRDSKLQFRGLYAYYPDTDEVFKIYGVGPRQVADSMMDGYYKYNSGGKKFTQIHTKHLTVTIDGFTIHNSLWLGKKTKLPDKKDMALVIQNFSSNQPRYNMHVAFRYCKWSLCLLLVKNENYRPYYASLPSVSLVVMEQSFSRVFGKSAKSLRQPDNDPTKFKFCQRKTYVQSFSHQRVVYLLKTSDINLCQFQNNQVSLI